jgi:hypothetical protein
LLAALLPLLTGCEFEAHEIARTASPDGTLDIVVTEGSAHATDSLWLDIYIVAKGAAGDLDRDDAVLRASRHRDVSARWMDDRTVEIAYRQAQIAHFTNIAYPMSPGDWDVSVALELRKLD